MSGGGRKRGGKKGTKERTKENQAEENIQGKKQQKEKAGNKMHSHRQPPRPGDQGQPATLMHIKIGVACLIGKETFFQNSRLDSALFEGWGPGKGGEKGEGGDGRDRGEGGGRKRLWGRG